ncbi:muts domain V-domain-containing protein [Pilobolus umbonatus]|nr:muts domain V-domain-containing protein [Pilobolus umbonatus]
MPYDNRLLKSSQKSERPSTVNHTRRTPRVIMAISEGRGISPEIGTCTFDVNSCECSICQFTDSQMFTQTIHNIYIDNPQRILLNKASNTEHISKLRSTLHDTFTQAQCIDLPRKYFGDEAGLNYIQTFGIQEESINFIGTLSTEYVLDVVRLCGYVLNIQTNRYYCLTAIAGVFSYMLENNEFSFSPHTIKFTYKSADGITMIDTNTADDLELTKNRNDQNKHTLLNTIDYTCTPMGKRLLRINILQPFYQLPVIENRLDAVEKLLMNEEILFEIQSSLKILSDLDMMIAYISKVPKSNRFTQNKSTVMFAAQYAESKVNNIIQLKNTLHSIKSIAGSLSLIELDDCPLLNNILECLCHPSFNTLSQAINETINEEVGIEKSGLGLRNQKCYAVKAGVNGLLDVARQAYKETVQDVYEIIENYSEVFGLPIKLQFNASLGFYITLQRDKLTEGDDIPFEFINVQKKKKFYQFTTLEILQKNRRIEESLSEVYLMSDSLLSSLLQVFRDHIHLLYETSEAISQLDLLSSFAMGKSYNNYTRPEFSDILAIKAGKHPILANILTCELTPNDTFASFSSNFQFVTGPNMSGKTTYLRQIALLSIMAQIGSCVPAEYASFKLVDRILSRLANDSNTATAKMSSFMLEMRDISFVLQHVTDNSLIIIDELGRGTSHSDALGITAAISESLILSKTNCFFATHFHELTNTLCIYPNVVNLQFNSLFEKSEEVQTVSYSYKIQDGRLSTKEHYGLQTAQILGFPREVLIYANDILRKLNKQDITVIEPLVDSQSKYHRKLLWFADKVLQISQTPLSEQQMMEQLIELKSLF